jgi:transposase InsO family protein
MQNLMLGRMMFVRELVNLETRMSCYYILFRIFKRLRNGHLTLSDQLIHRLNTQAKVVRDCSIDTTTRFIFENIITRFGCTHSLTSDQGSHFINETIATLTREFIIQHHKNSPYHPKENGIVKALNNILERGLTKLCYTNREN